MTEQVLSHAWKSLPWEYLRTFPRSPSLVIPMDVKQAGMEESCGAGLSNSYVPTCSESWQQVAAETASCGLRQPTSECVSVSVGKRRAEE